MPLTVKSFANARGGKPDVLNSESRAAVVAVVVEYLRLWAKASFVDGEYIAEAGEWVGQSQHNEMDVAVWDVLQAELSFGMQDAVSAFLDGYWTRHAVSDTFDLTAYATALDTLPLEARAYAATALALYSALSTASRLDDAQKAFIRRQLLIAREKLLARNLFPHVLGSLNYLVAPKHRP